MSPDKARFLPFNALNEFMRDDYRHVVIQEVLSNLDALPKSQQAAIETITRKAVSVPGFRNSAKAPLVLRVKGMQDAFTRSAPTVAAVLAGWSELHADLRQQVHALLSERGWPVYPVEADRTHLPGFHITWPKNEDFDVINQAFKEKYPHLGASEDDISLMTVWVSMRLPYQLEEDEADEPAADAAAGAAPAV